MAYDERFQTDVSSIDFILDRDNPLASDLSGCTLITGFYGIGKIGFISVNHMIQKLNAKRIGYIVTDYVPPFVSVKDERLILPFELYRSEELVFLAPFFEPYKYEHRAFSKAIVMWAIQEKFRQIILVGGLDSRLRKEEDIFAKAVYTKVYQDQGFLSSIDMLDEGLYVTGPLALILMFSEVYRFPAMAILSYAERSRPDPIGAAHAVEIVNDLVMVNCGVEELIQEAENIEKEISEMMEASENSATEDDGDRDSDRGLFM